MQTIDLTRDQILTILDDAGIEHEDYDGYQGMDDLSEAQEVAEALVNAHDGANLSFSWESNSDGEIGMAAAGIYLPTSGLYLTDAIDRKNVTDDRDATGTDAALAYATALIHSFNRAIKHATGHGLS